MLKLLHYSNIYIHVVAGSIGLISFPILIFNKKGSGLHIKLGKLFYASAIVLGITAINGAIFTFIAPKIFAWDKNLIFILRGGVWLAVTLLLCQWGIKISGQTLNRSAGTSTLKPLMYSNFIWIPICFTYLYYVNAFYENHDAASFYTMIPTYLICLFLFSHNLLLLFAFFLAHKASNVAWKLVHAFHAIESGLLMYIGLIFGAAGYPVLIKYLGRSNAFITMNGAFILHAAIMMALLGYYLRLYVSKESRMMSFYEK